MVRRGSTCPPDPVHAKARTSRHALEGLMKIRNISALVAMAAMLSLAACDKAKMARHEEQQKAKEAKPASADPVANALSAAPAGVAAGAAVVAAQPDGTMKTLREGTNGFTCMADNPDTPGPDPMCMDANAMEWAAAWMGHKTPPAGKVGLMYM